nr:N-6 DNA methylase [uncultured Oscillibacter sp.]
MGMARHHIFRDEAQKTIATTMDKLSGRYSRWEIWQDFIMMSAISLANAVESPHRGKREQMYLDRAKKYSKEELDSLASMMGAVVMGMEANPEQDMLGELYMNLSLGNDAAGQFFTPYHISHFMAEVTADDSLKARIKQKGWISVCDPCCGGGSLLVAFANVCRRKGINFQTSVLFAAQDIDPTVAMMCYIQLSLMGCAGFVKVGNSLTDPITSFDDRALLPVESENIWFTPMYYRDVWQWRRIWAWMDLTITLKAAPQTGLVSQAEPLPVLTIAPADEKLIEGQGGQLKLF